MRLTSTICVLLILAAFPYTLSAQDTRFSQFYAAPHHMNPALTGVYEGGYRFIANYRELYNTIMARTAYRSVAAHFDVRKKIAGNNDFIGFGISALRDQAGIAKFVNQYAHIGGSYMKHMGTTRKGSKYLVLGAQLGYGQRGFDFDVLWFSNQFDPITGRINREFSGEPLEAAGDMRPTSNYLDFNAGVLWYTTFQKNGSFYIGGALYHLNQPNVSFMEGQVESLGRRWVGQAGAELPFTDQFSFMPAVAAMGQNQNMSVTAGGNFRYFNDHKGELGFRFGLWAHIGNRLEQGVLLDNMAVTTFLELDRWDVGVSYDFTTSSLKQANNSRGGVEVSLIYRGKAQYKSRINCPNL